MSCSLVLFSFLFSLLFFPLFLSDNWTGRLITTASRATYYRHGKVQRDEFYRGERKNNNSLIGNSTVPDGMRVNRWFCCTDRNRANNWWILIARYGYSTGCYVDQSWIGWIYFWRILLRKNLTRIVDEYELKALSHFGWIVCLFIDSGENLPVWFESILNIWIFSVLAVDGKILSLNFIKIETLKIYK